eukprot:TRINITY_DN494_c0_g1_i7.p1 TRINITY_DN494_c0_g1~~TRINITY_DN494_c0_g1_i7.p1  ORF type:complete len:830 (-),score=185.15 TRINITY_DN494_c0_g1_i7:63-2552(-)
MCASRALNVWCRYEGLEAQLHNLQRDDTISMVRKRILDESLFKFKEEVCQTDLVLRHCRGEQCAVLGPRATLGDIAFNEKDDSIEVAIEKPRPAPFLTGKEWDMLNGSVRAIKWEFQCTSDDGDGVWSQSAILAKIEEKPFAAGCMRVAFKMTDLSNPSQVFVAKKYSSKSTGREAYFFDVKMQMLARRWSEKYNAKNPPKKVEFLETFVIELVDLPIPRTSPSLQPQGSQAPASEEVLYGVERFVEGKFIKYNNNSGFVNIDQRNTPQAFSHFTYEESQKSIIIVDIQGVDDHYTDPQIHTADPKTSKFFSSGNCGTKGMEEFIRSHSCNPICKYLQLFPINPTKEISGTVPATPEMIQNFWDNTEEERKMLPRSPALDTEEKLKGIEMEHKKGNASSLSISQKVEQRSPSPPIEKRKCSPDISPARTLPSPVMASAASDGDKETVEKWRSIASDKIREAFMKDCPVEENSKEAPKVEELASLAAQKIPFSHSDEFREKGALERSMTWADVGTLADPLDASKLSGSRKKIPSFDKKAKEILPYDKIVMTKSLDGEHRDTVTSLCSACGVIISGSADSTVKIWSSSDYSLKSTLRNIVPVSSICSNEKSIFSSSPSSDGIQVWDLVSLKMVSTLKDSIVNGIDVKGDLLCAGSKDKTIKMWDVRSGKCTQTLNGHQKSVKCVLMSKDYVFSGSNDHLVKVWDLRKSEESCITFKGHTHWVQSLCLNGKYLYSCSVDRKIRIWDLSVLNCAATLSEHNSVVDSIAFGSGCLFSGSDDNQIKVWPSDGLVERCSSAATLDVRKGGVASLMVRDDVLYAGSSSSIKIFPLTD